MQCFPFHGFALEERRDFLEEGNSVRASIGNERKKLLATKIQVKPQRVSFFSQQYANSVASPQIATFNF